MDNLPCDEHYAVHDQFPKFPYFQVSFNPNDNAQFCVVGNGVFKTYKYNEGNLKANPIQKIEPQNFLCHSWLSEDRIIVGTDTGKMLLFEGQEHKKDFHVSSPVAPESTGGDRWVF